MDIGKFIEEFHERLKMPCSKTFRIRVPKKATAQANSLVDRVIDNNYKKTNSLRRGHQRTRNEEKLRGT